MSERDKRQTEHNEYLWEGTGEPDTEIQRLEQALKEFRATSLVPPAFPVIDYAPRRSSWWLATTSKTWAPRLAAATLTLAAFTIALVLSLRESTPPDSHTGWSGRAQ